MGPKLDAWLAATAGTQHGVVARWQIVAAGFTTKEIRVRLERGQLHRAYRGVYAVGHHVLSPHGRWMAAVLVGGRGSALSHVSAAVLHRMLDSAGGTIHVTAPGGGGRRERDGLVLHRSARIERGVVLGIPVTTPARTLVDLAAHAPERTIRTAIRGAERQRILDVREVREQAKGRAGARTLDRVLAAWDDAPTHDELEERFLELCARHGIARPDVNVPLLDSTVDFLWREQRVVVETDGMATHGDVASALADRERDAALTRAGFRPQRFTWHQVVRDERATAATLAALGLQEWPVTSSTRRPSGSRR
jgi:very-short-patch-repair endonuclease